LWQSWLRRWSFAIRSVLQCWCPAHVRVPLRAIQKGLGPPMDHRNLLREFTLSELMAQGEGFRVWRMGAQPSNSDEVEWFTPGVAAPLAIWQRAPVDLATPPPACPEEMWLRRLLAARLWRLGRNGAAQGVVHSLVGLKIHNVAQSYMSHADMAAYVSRLPWVRMLGEAPGEAGSAGAGATGADRAIRFQLLQSLSSAGASPDMDPTDVAADAYDELAELSDTPAPTGHATGDDGTMRTGGAGSVVVAAAMGLGADENWQFPTLPPPPADAAVYVSPMMLPSDPDWRSRLDKFGKALRKALECWCDEDTWVELSQAARVHPMPWALSGRLEFGQSDADVYAHVPGISVVVGRHISLPVATHIKWRRQPGEWAAAFGKALVDVNDPPPTCYMELWWRRSLLCLLHRNNVRSAAQHCELGDVLTPAMGSLRGMVDPPTALYFAGQLPWATVELTAPLPSCTLDETGIDTRLRARLTLTRDVFAPSRGGRGGGGGGAGGENPGE
jgi:hypothetical protein